MAISMFLVLIVAQIIVGPIYFYILILKNKEEWKYTRDDKALLIGSMIGLCFGSILGYFLLYFEGLFEGMLTGILIGSVSCYVNLLWHDRRCKKVDFRTDQELKYFEKKEQDSRFMPKPKLPAKLKQLKDYVKDN